MINFSQLVGATWMLADCICGHD